MTVRIGRHEVAELRLDTAGAMTHDAVQTPWLEVTDPLGITRRLPAFRTSDRAVTARYASGVEGSHGYRWLAADGNELRDGPVGHIVVLGSSTASAPLHHGPVRISASGRSFEHEDGTPFLWLGDTWWHALTPRISDEELSTLAAQRVEQGFTLVQLVVGPLPEVREFEPRGETVGGFSWETGWSRIRPAFFDAADRRVRILLDAGLVPCIVGAWGYHLDDAGIDVMKAHWHELVARYAAYPVIWVIAGEASLPWYDQLFLPETPSHAARLAAGWAEVARSTRKLDPFGRPMTVHPSPGVDAYASLDVFPDTTLTDYQMLQTGHWDRGSLPTTMATVSRIRAAVPGQPVLNGEVCYEGIMGASWPDVQRFLWWAQVLAGAAGHTYGAQGLWGMNDGSFVGQVGSWGGATWQEAAALPGAAHVGAARRWLSERPWTDMEPANERIVPGASWGSWLRPYAARCTNGRLICYLPSAAMLDNGASDPRSYREVTLRGFQPGAAVHLSYVEPRSMTTSLEERHLADASGDIVLRRNMLAAMPSMEDWVVEAVPEAGSTADRAADADRAQAPLMG